MVVSDWLPESLLTRLSLIRAELAFFPGRANTTLRLTITCILVIIISMSCQIPFLTISIVIVFYTIQANVVMTRLIGTIIIASLPLSFVTEILLLKYTYDYPMLRFFSASLIFFISMYLMRILKIGFLFFGLAIVILYLQSFADLTDLTEYLTNQILWSNAAMAYPAILALLINTYFFPAEPLVQLQAETHRQLSYAANRLESLLAGDKRRPRLLSVEALQQGAVILQKLLQFVVMGNPKDYAGKLYRQACIVAVSHLRLTCNTLPEMQIASSSTLHTVLRRLSEQILLLDNAMMADVPYHLDWTPTQEERSAMQGLPQTENIYQTLLALSCFTVPPLPSDTPVTKEPLVVSDALTNPIYIRYALKALLCSVIAYVFYNAVQWAGIHTIMLTCAIVANPTLGSSIRKINLRVYGGALGSIAALALFIFVFPYIDGITGMLLSILPIFALGAWIAAGSERSSYIGLQAIGTMSLALFEHYGPGSSLTEIRDRLVGILLGVALCTFVYKYLWPESENNMLREKISSMLRTLSALLRPQTDKDAPDQQINYAQQYLKCWGMLNECEELLARVALEPEFQTGEPAAQVHIADELLKRSKQIMTAQDVLHSHSLSRLLIADTASIESFHAIQSLQSQTSNLLEEYAQSIERTEEPSNEISRQLLSSAESLTAQHAPATALMVADAQRLARHVASLSDWAQQGVSAPETTAQIAQRAT